MEGGDERTRRLRAPAPVVVPEGPSHGDAPVAARDRAAATVSDTGTGATHRALAATAPATPVAPLIDDLVGTSLDRYRVLERLGAGGMGVVYAALDPALERKVALKVLPPLAEARGAHLEARLRREAQALARLDHPNVVRVYDVGVAARSVYVAMQLVDGPTLAEHLAQHRPPPKQVLALFLAAGRGLAAAHAAGIVHRDVKPSNVLVDRAGGVFVGDFGLARGADEVDARADAGSRPRSPATATLLDETMTREGSVLGTPLFMAPEQHRGEPATTRSDQFSFCVSLWQALFGMHPFVDGRWGAGALEAMARDAVRDPPPRVVRKRVVRALRRGMRHDPEARWPTMAALIGELQPRSRARWVAVGLAAGGIFGGVALASVAGIATREDPCRNAGAGLVAVWGPSSAKQMTEAFARTQLPYASTLVTDLTATLDRYGAAWGRMRVDACRATRDRGEQSDELYDRRMRCLDRRLAQLGEVVHVLGDGPTGAVVDRSRQLVDALPPLDECADVAALAEQTAAPRSAADRAAVAQLDAEIARARVSSQAGVLLAPQATADPLVARARATGDAGVLGRALLLLGEVQGDSDDHARAITSWREAARAAAAAHDDRVVTQATIKISNMLVIEGHPDQALQAVDDAQLLAAGIAADPDLQASIARARGGALNALERFSESDEAYRQSIAITSAAHGPASTAAAEAMFQRSKGLLEAARYRDAAEQLDLAIPILESTLGPGHPELALAHNNLGTSYMQLGKQADARRELAIALAMKRQREPGGSVTTAATLQSLGGLELDSGNLDAAGKAFAEAYALRARLLGPDNPVTLSSQYQLGVLARMQGRYDDARALLGQVLTARLKAHGEHHTSVANVLDAIANVDQAQGRYDDARTGRLRSLAIRERVLGPYSADVTRSLLGLAEIASERDRCDEALGYSARAVDVITHNGGDWWDRIEPLGIAANCETAPRKLGALRAELAPLVDQALAGPDIDRKADTQAALGMVLWKQGERGRGAALIREAARLYRDSDALSDAAPLEAWLAKASKRR
ncbi:MAG: serine/threonine-protein kinase [Deltaproteobacteria bacterium]|nr:serine/threonine-protein kinase [Deltaproteobacteria bacterium]